MSVPRVPGSAAGAKKIENHGHCLQICNVRDSFCCRKTPKNFRPPSAVFPQNDPRFRRVTHVFADRPMTPTPQGGGLGRGGEGGPSKTSSVSWFCRKSYPMPLVIGEGSSTAAVASIPTGRHGGPLVIGKDASATITRI